MCLVGAPRGSRVADVGRRAQVVRTRCTLRALCLPIFIAYFLCFKLQPHVRIRSRQSIASLEDIELN